MSPSYAHQSLHPIVLVQQVCFTQTHERNLDTHNALDLHGPRTRAELEFSGTSLIGGRAECGAQAGARLRIPSINVVVYSKCVLECEEACERVATPRLRRGDCTGHGERQKEQSENSRM